MRYLVLFLAGCSFAPRFASGDARGDAPLIDASGGPDAPIDALTLDAPAVDAPTPDAAMPDAPQLAQVSYVQGASDVGSSTGSRMTLSQAVSDGDLCVVGFGISGNAIASVTDSGGDTFTSVPVAGVAVYVAANMHASASDTITVSFTGTTGYAAATAVYRGLAHTSPFDDSASASGTSATLDSGAVTSSHPHDLVVGFAASDGTQAAGSGFTKRVGGTFSLIEDEEVTTAGSYHATATATGTVSWAMAAVALKAAD